MKDPKAGDKVEWETSQGTTAGVVKKKLTKPRMIKGQKVAASPDDPEYLVETTKSKKLAAHKAESLKKAAGRK